MAAAIISVGAWAREPSNRTGAIRASGAIPSTRSSSAARPAMIPAIGVPWFSQSSPVPRACSNPPPVRVARKSTGGSTAPASFGCRASTPESTTETVTPRPFVSSHTRRSPNRLMSGSWPAAAGSGAPGPAGCRHAACAAGAVSAVRPLSATTRARTMAILPHARISSSIV